MMVERKGDKNKEMKVEENSMNIQEERVYDTERVENPEIIKNPKREAVGRGKDHELRKEMIRGIKFGLFSISAGIIEIVAFSLLNELTSWRYWPCYVSALILSVLWNFTLNRRYTFRSANNVSIAMLKVLVFYLVYIPVSTLLGEYLAHTLLWNEYLVTLIIMLANFILEFLYDRFFVFGTSLDTNHLVKQRKNGRVDVANK